MGNYNKELVEKAEAFIKAKFDESEFLNAHPADKEYRLQHSYRVANIGKRIAEAEGFDVTETVVACLLHDVSYCLTFDEAENSWENHGRNSARMVREFLESTDMEQERIEQICYGIAIHVDDKADFEGERTPFAETVGDADNIDRFDAYRIYEGLQYRKFSDMPFAEKQQLVEGTLKRLKDLRKMKLGTKTAESMWKERVDYNIGFYEKLKAQLENSLSVG